MAIFHLSDSKPTTLITGQNADRSILEFARLLTEQNAPFSIYVDEISEALLPFDRHIIRASDGLPSVVDVVVDLTWEGSIDPLTEDVLETFPHALVLSSAVTTTATQIQSVFNNMHIINFNGLPGMFTHQKVVEIAPSRYTFEEHLHFAQRYFQSLGFDTEVVEDRVGLVMPRILSMIINEAAFCIMEKVATPADIDIAMKLGTNYPKGPLEWADEIGLDLILDLLDALKFEYGQERYRPCVLLKQYVYAGWIGKQTGRGFYHYDGNGAILSE